MKAKRHKKLTKARVAAIISSAVVIALFVSLVITNIFIPVKYITAYMVAAGQRQKGVLTVTFIDVGYGDCTLCELPDGKVLLIDGGDGSYPNNLAVLSKLNSRGIDRIDYLFCTSVLGEYCGGLPEIMRYKSVGKIFMPALKNTYITEEYRAFASAAEQSGAEIAYSCFGQGERGEDYFFTVLSPSSPQNPQGFYARLDSSATAENMLNASAVIWLEYAGASFAFTSSAGSEALGQIVTNYEAVTSTGGEYAPMGEGIDITHCSVASVPGHGSGECTNARWYDLINPSSAVISVGETYSGYPSAQALADVGSCASPVLTSVHGDITFTVTAEGVIMS